MSDNTGKLVRARLWFDDGFAMVPNTWARDKFLTNQARGLLVQLVSHDAGYEVTIDALSRSSMNGRDAIRAQVGELERAGYLKRYRRRERGRIVGIDWLLRDPHASVDNGTPLDGLEPVEMKKARSEPAPGNPAPDNPTPVNPAPVDPTTIEDQLQEDPYSGSTDSATDAREPCPVTHEPHVVLDSGYCRDCAARGAA